MHPTFPHDPTGAPTGAWGTPTGVAPPLGAPQGHHADGVAGGPADPNLGLASPTAAFSDARTKMSQWRATLERIRRVEGPRGYAVRGSVAFKWAAQVLFVLIAAAICHAAFAGTSYSSMGTLVLFSAAVMAVTAAIGTMFIPHKRPEIIEEFRHVLFHLCLAPAVALSGFTWVMGEYLSDPRNGDAALNSIQGYLPIICLFTVVAPAFVLVKMVSGRRHLDRSSQDDAELMSTWTRQDRWVR
jgi:hypothetical protein